MMIMMIVHNALVSQKEGAGGGRDGKSKKGRPNMNSDARRVRSHRSILLWGVGCEEHVKPIRWYGVLLNRRGKGG